MIAGAVVMLNLLWFRTVADYSASSALARATPISGAEAYERSVAHTMPYLRQSGGDLMFLGEGGRFLAASVLDADAPISMWLQLLLVTTENGYIISVTARK